MYLLHTYIILTIYFVLYLRQYYINTNVKFILIGKNIFEDDGCSSIPAVSLWCLSICITSSDSNAQAVNIAVDLHQDRASEILNNIFTRLFKLSVTKLKVNSRFVPPYKNLQIQFVGFHHHQLASLFILFKVIVLYTKHPIYLSCCQTQIINI